jgi:cysteinyl-tRNA synthetase
VLQPDQYIADIPADEAAFAGLEKSHPHTIKSAAYVAKLRAALQNDLDTPAALGAIEEFMSLVDTEGLTSFMLAEFTEMLQVIDRMLGIDLFTEDLAEHDKQLIADREAARAAKDWPKSDELRDMLAQAGIGIRDTATGTIWFRNGS